MSDARKTIIEADPKTSTSRTEETDDSELDIPTDEDSAGSLEDFIVNEVEDESNAESEHDISEDNMTLEDTLTSTESEEDECIVGYESDASYHPPETKQINVPVEPVRRSTRKRKATRFYNPADFEDSEEEEENAIDIEDDSDDGDSDHDNINILSNHSCSDTESEAEF